MSLPARSEIDHTAGRPQGWDDADWDLRRWVEDVVDRLWELRGVVGVYLHGSLATGTFFRPKSDVDLLAVVERPLDPTAHRPLAADLLRLHDRRPITGGLEMSVIRAPLGGLRPPLPFEHHFSEIWADQIRAGGVGPDGVDPDLAAHCAMARLRGRCLRGAPATETIPALPDGAMLDAAIGDATLILGGGIVESPFYGVLNLCRTVQLVVDQPTLPPSKVDGALWALDHLPAKHHPVIEAALACYRSAAPVEERHRRVHGHTWDQAPLRDFAAQAETLLRTG